MHPILDEICRSKGALQPHVMSRVQRTLRDEIAPILDDYERLKAENESLKAELETLKARRTKAA